MEGGWGDPSEEDRSAPGGEEMWGRAAMSRSKQDKNGGKPRAKANILGLACLRWY